MFGEEVYELGLIVITASTAIFAVLFSFLFVIKKRIEEVLDEQYGKRRQQK